MEIDKGIRDQFARLLRELEQRARKVKQLDAYYEGDAPFPAAVVQAKLTKAYSALMPMAAAPWGSVAIDSALDKLEPSGIDVGDADRSLRVWDEIWQANSLDAESKLAHSAALLHGRCFATVWPKGDDGVEITLDTAAQMVVEYREGSRYDRRAALRVWEDDGKRYATLYRPEATYKFVQDNKNGVLDTGDGVKWATREEDGQWPLKNHLGKILNVELAVNRRLKPGRFPYARGEFEHATGLLDRINLLTFLGLVVSLWMGFPLRGVVGEKILYDDDGEALAPFDAHADSIFQLENPDAKIVEYGHAERGNLSIFGELAQFAYITKTPAHYIPIEGGISNVSADTIRALNMAENAKITGHKASLGEGWETVVSLSHEVKFGEPLPAGAELKWKDHEPQSMAERADAFSKLLAGGLPWQVAAEEFLNFTPQMIRRAEELGRDNALTQLLQVAAEPISPPPEEADEAEPAAV